MKIFEGRPKDYKSNDEPNLYNSYIKNNKLKDVIYILFNNLTFNNEIKTNRPETVMPIEPIDQIDNYEEIIYFVELFEREKEHQIIYIFTNKCRFFYICPDFNIVCEHYNFNLKLSDDDIDDLINKIKKSHVCYVPYFKLLKYFYDDKIEYNKIIDEIANKIVKSVHS